MTNTKSIIFLCLSLFFWHRSLWSNNLNNFDTEEIEKKIEHLVNQMSLKEKIGQMTQVEIEAIKPHEIKKYSIGSLLSAGGQSPETNDAISWLKMVNERKVAALKSRLKIPLLYATDAVHGHNNLKGAVLFPHNIGLGATRNLSLVRRVAKATALELAATGIWGNFAPCLAVPQDIRWGRTYEGFGEKTKLVSRMGAAYIKGLQNIKGEKNLSHPQTVMATAKHFVADGGAKWGTSKKSFYRIDRGDSIMSEKELRRVHLPPYRQAIKAGVDSIMVSFTSWNGVKMHAHRYLLTDVLKKELGFNGFLISDWAAIFEIPGTFEDQIAASVNAGLDMIMVPLLWKPFIAFFHSAVEKGKIPVERIDDAVKRILRTKYKLGLFDQPMGTQDYIGVVGSQKHRRIARRAVAQSQVLLKNKNNLLPLAKNVEDKIFVAGVGANDIGMQSGGWSLSWQGKMGSITAGTTILKAIQKSVNKTDQIVFKKDGSFKKRASLGIVIVGERPYSEGYGDKGDLHLHPKESALIFDMRQKVDKLIIILISGRPMIITRELEIADAFIASWLPGTEGDGVADVLFGRKSFGGKLSYTWPKSMKFFNEKRRRRSEILFPYGFGLTTKGW